MPILFHFHSSLILSVSRSRLLKILPRSFKKCLEVWTCSRATRLCSKFSGTQWTPALTSRTGHLHTETRSPPSRGASGRGWMSTAPWFSWPTPRTGGCAAPSMPWPLRKFTVIHSFPGVWRTFRSRMFSTRLNIPHHCRQDLSQEMSPHQKQGRIEDSRWLLTPILTSRLQTQWGMTLRDFLRL